MYSEILQKLGLSPNEAKIYEMLLVKGESKAIDLVPESGLGRGNVYNVLTTLKKKGLVLEGEGKKTLFTAANPETLRTLAKSQILSAEDLYSRFESTLPDLKSLFQLITNKPAFRVFEGVEGMKEIYLETLRAKEPIYALVGPDAPEPSLYKWLTTTYVKKRLAEGIHAYVLASGTGEQTEEYKKKSAAELRTVVSLNSSVYPFKGEVDVFGNSVAFISYGANELIGFIIESPALATTLRSVVKVAVDATGAAVTWPQLPSVPPPGKASAG